MCLIVFGFSSKKATLVSIPARKKIKMNKSMTMVKQNTASGAQIWDLPSSCCTTQFPPFASCSLATTKKITRATNPVT